MKLKILFAASFAFYKLNVTAQPAYPPAPVKNVKVAVVLQDPPIPSQNGMRFHELFNWSDPLILVENLRDSLNGVSHGVLNYSIDYIYDDTLFFERMGGVLLTRDSFASLLLEPGWTTLHSSEQSGNSSFDYNMMIDYHNLCAKRDSNLINEVWVYGPPINGSWESCMAGSNAFWINGPVITGTTCSDLLPIMGLNYERGLDMAMHSYGHRVENTMLHVYGRWSYTAANPNNWERFSSYDAVWPDSAHCGNVHFPPNALNDYEVANTNFTTTYADQWLNYPVLTGNQRSINCTEWNCDAEGELGHLSWWYRHFPYFDCTNPNDLKLNNWWHYVVDYNEAVATQNAFNNNSVSCNLLSVEDLNYSKDIILSPNPFTTQTSFALGKEVKNACLKIYNIFGQEIKEMKNITGQKINLNRENLSNGIYFYKLMLENRVIATGKLIAE